MKTVLLGMMALMFATQANASANPYAPTLQSVVVLNDTMEDEFSPFLFQLIQGEILELGMDESCKQIQVSSDQSVFCFSNTKKPVLVGKLGAGLGAQEGWGIHAVNWNNNVSIVEKFKNGKTIYSLVVAP